jgi:ATP adenylyltransferase
MARRLAYNRRMSREEREYFYSFDKLDYVRGKRPDGCVLCAIRDGKAGDPDLSVHRDRLFVVTVNLYPYNPGHLLIFPARHVEDVRSLDDREALHLHRLQAHLLAALDRTHAPRGYNIGYNMGSVAGGSIAHLHLHVIPRFPNETGIADLIAGKRILVEDPRVTAERLRGELAQLPFSFESD